MDLISSNLQATNEKFNKVLSNLEKTKTEALANLETAAATATAEISSQLSNVDSELRSLVPEGFSVPNVNLQGQLQSLSGLTDLTQSANLLASITADFGDALSASGFSLDTLVSDAASAFGSGDTLSGIVPNFERSPLGDVVQKANAVKLPDLDPVVEETSTFTQNTEVTAAKTTAASSVRETSETLPTEDSTTYKVTEKSKKVTQSQGGQSITKEVTTATEAVEETTTGGEVTVTRRNISPKGFSNRKRHGADKFHETRPGHRTVTKLGGSEELGIEYKVTLSREPSRIKRVIGFTSKTSEHTSYTTTDGRKRRRRIWKLKPENGPGDKATALAGKFYPQDTYRISSDNPKEIIINEHFREYDSENIKYRITYVYDETYDPGY